MAAEMEHVVKSYEHLLRRRGANFLVYAFVKNCVLGPLAKRFFDLHVYGREHIPEKSCVIATHHCLSFDWATMYVLLDRKAHGWIDAEVLSKVRFLGALGELISVTTRGGPDSMSDYRKTREISKMWLTNTDEFVVTVTDGPSKHSCHEDGTITGLAERPNLAGATSVAVAAKAPIVPYSSWIPDEHQQALFSSKGILADLRYLERNRKIPYVAEFCEPIDTSDASNRRNLRDEVRRRQLASNERLRARGLAHLESQAS